MAERFPGLLLAAGRLGSGSDVLGLDDAVSRDHDWGLRLSLFVPADAVEEVDRELEQRLPDAFRGLPVRFAFTGATESQHHVEVSSVGEFADARLGFDPREGMSVTDWLSVSGQAALELTAGPVFVDATGELSAVRGALRWYPDDVWRYVLACDWIRIEQELPLMGRAADVGDDLGSRVIAARLAQTIMHLAFLLERRWPPYAKWFGSLFRTLACADEVQSSLHGALRAGNGADRQRGIAAALEELNRHQTEIGLSDVHQATVPFWDRPYVHPHPAIVAQLLDAVVEEEVRRLPRGRGSVEQRTDNVDVLVDAGARRAAVALKPCTE
ncbi:DUF4037 domain-containing protein [Labedella endophytica]|uniref:DUF4037 domain-containing protein n=2 Tax=Labedella endophytica TaxID=1523160 RepID=A0A433JUY6_9MICO|nr:DUF4037 domain-containing protein [Labedella endophytica]